MYKHSKILYAMWICGNVIKHLNFISQEMNGKSLCLMGIIFKKVRIMLGNFPSSTILHNKTVWYCGQI